MKTNKENILFEEGYNNILIIEWNDKLGLIRFNLGKQKVSIKKLINVLLSIVSNLKENLKK